MARVIMTAEGPTKICSKCGKNKRLDTGYRLRKSGNPYAACKKCEYKANRNYRRERGLEKGVGVWKAEHPEKIVLSRKRCKKRITVRAYRRNYYAAHRERIMELQKIRREKHLAKYKARDKRYRQNNKEKLAEYNRNYRINNRETYNERARAYYWRKKGFPDFKGAPRYQDGGQHTPAPSPDMDTNHSILEHEYSGNPFTYGPGSY